MCMCVNVCFHGSEKVILTARDHSLFVCAWAFMHTNICKLFVKALRCVYVFELCVSLHVHTCIHKPYLHASQSNHVHIHRPVCVACVYVCVALAQRNAGSPVGLGNLLGGHIK